MFSCLSLSTITRAYWHVFYHVELFMHFITICTIIPPRKTIVNATSNITYRPPIEANDTGRCNFIIWPIFVTRLISFTWPFKWENYLNSLSNKTVIVRKNLHSCVVFDLCLQFKRQKKFRSFIKIFIKCHLLKIHSCIWWSEKNI